MNLVKTTRLGLIQRALGDAIILSLKGEPLVDGDGDIIMVDGKPLLGPPKTGSLKEAREYLKDRGVTSEAEDGESYLVHEVSKAISRFDEDQDQLLLSATKEAMESST